MNCIDSRKDFFTAFAYIMEEGDSYFEAGWEHLLSPYIDFPVFKKLFLSPTRRRADWIYCPLEQTCDRGCAPHITEEDSKYYAVCRRKKFTRQPVRPESLWYLKMDLPRFHEKIAAVLPIEPSVEQTAKKCSWLLGTMNYGGGQRRRVFISYEFPFDLAKEIVRLSLLDPFPVMVLTPCRPNLSSDDDFIINGIGAAHLALNEIIGIDSQCRLSLRANLPPRILELFNRPAVKTGQNNELVIPLGATWRDIRLRFLDAYTMSCRIGQSNTTINFNDLKMANKKTGMPDKNWLYLQQLAVTGGTRRVDWANATAALREQQRKRITSKALQTFFGIDTEPIVFDRKTSTYICQFGLKPETDSTRHRPTRIR